MMESDLNSFRQEKLPLLEQQMKNFLQGLDAEKSLQKSMQYSLESGGKRIRPLLMLAVCQVLKKRVDEPVFAAAGSLEFVHTYSLIHDDLPEMDNDDLRRGRPTNHKVFGQAEAVLAGDGLLTASFEWLANCQLPSELKLKLIGLLATAAGPQGMVSGQVADIEGEHKELKLAQLQLLHRRKTGALIQYACQAGGLIGDANARQMIYLTQFGQSFGLAFQINDDILDVVSTQEKLGKAVHKDQAENKNTYPGLLGLKESYSELKRVVQKAKNALEGLQKNLENGKNTELLWDFLDYFSRKGNA
ncbi:polyprenyl synthetase family protein [Liquorilactobacillus oeni]